MTPWQYLRDVLDACESVGAYMVEYCYRSVVLEWPRAEVRIEVVSLFLPDVIRRLPNLDSKEAVP